MKNLDKLSCVCSQRSDLILEQDTLLCTNKDCFHSQTKNGFRLFRNIPILISNKETDTLFSPNDINSYVERKKDSWLVKIIRQITFGRATLTEKNCSTFIDLLKSDNKQKDILIIGSGEIGNGAEALFNDKKLNTIGTDVYLSDNVDYVSDAHYLPFKSKSFDGVWIQAVLEHVLDPQQVVSEIYRVLRDDGYVYAETPFMQQVHEGAYDFTRFTLIGHRYLFKSFKQVKMGGNKGAGVALAWSIKYFFWAFFRSRFLGTILSLPFTIILRFLDNFISSDSLYDSSSGVYFLGKKAQIKLSKRDLISLYKGLQ